MRTSEDAPGPMDFFHCHQRYLLSMDRLYTNSNVFYFNEHGYIADVKVPCICDIYCTSVNPREGDPSIKAVVPVPSKANHDCE